MVVLSGRAFRDRRACQCHRTAQRTIKILPSWLHECPSDPTLRGNDDWERQIEVTSRTHKQPAIATCVLPEYGCKRTCVESRYCM
jgi:hypothetical protein